MPTNTYLTWWKQFKETGNIAPLRLGCTREDVLALFGEPDATATTSRKHRKPAIWKYGELEFHFSTGDKDVLILLYSEHADGSVDVSIPMRLDKNNA